MKRTGVAVGVILLGCTLPGCPPSTTAGNLEVLFGSTVDFQTVVAQAPAAFDQGQLQNAPFATLPSGDVSVTYSDGFSTDQSQTQVIVMARDPAEYRATLESLLQAGQPTPNPIPPNFDFDAYWKQQVSSVGDSFEPTYGIALPLAQELPFPLSIAGTTVTNWPLLPSTFGGSGSAPFSGAAAADNGSVKGIYLEQTGLCSSTVAYHSKDGSGIIDQYIGTGPAALRSSIEDGANVAGVTLGIAHDTMNVATFISKESEDAIVGGFVTDFFANVAWSLPFSDNAQEDFNYTFTFGLKNGILSAPGVQNGEFDTGTLSGTIAGKITEKFASTIDDTIYLAALTKQSQPIPSLSETSDPDCASNIAQRPPKCFVSCTGDFDPATNARPGPLGPGNTDDSAWYAASYCRTIANELSAVAIGQATADGVSGPEATALGNLLNSTTTDESSLNNVRCNFYPAYETATQCDGGCVGGGGPGGKCPPSCLAVPVCEVVARAKRLNVYPDQAQLVWFDGSNLKNMQTIADNEQGNPALALYFALQSLNDTSALCDVKPFTTFPPAVEFVHATGSF